MQTNLKMIISAHSCKWWRGLPRSTARSGSDFTPRSGYFKAMGLGTSTSLSSDDSDPEVCFYLDAIGTELTQVQENLGNAFTTLDG